MLSKWRPRRSTDDRRTPTPYGSFATAKSPMVTGQFTVNVSAAAGLSNSAGIPRLHPPLRRSSLPARLGSEPLPAPAARPAVPSSTVDSRCRAQVARTAASLLAVELGSDGGKAARGARGARRIGGYMTRSKAADDDYDSPTSVLDAEQEPAPASTSRWQLRGSFGKANDMLRTGMRQGLVTGL